MNILTNNYKCTICERSFSYSNWLRLHMKAHTANKPLQCRKCEKGFLVPEVSLNIWRHVKDLILHTWLSVNCASHKIFLFKFYVCLCKTIWLRSICRCFWEKKSSRDWLFDYVRLQNKKVLAVSQNKLVNFSLRIALCHKDLQISLFKIFSIVSGVVD